MNQGPVALLLVALAACSRSEQRTPAAEPPSTTGRPLANTVNPGCPTIVYPVRVSAESIGPLSTTRNIQSQRNSCPISRETTFDSFESRFPAVVFEFDSLNAIAIQHLDDYATNRPADAWSITGCGGRLPKGVSTCATWGELIDAFGVAGQGSTEFGPASVRLTGLPGFSFELDVSDKEVGSLEVQPDLSRVPKSARIVRVSLKPR